MNEKLKEIDIELLKDAPEEAPDIVTYDSVKFVAELHRLYNQPREELLATRKVVQTDYNTGLRPDFIPHDDKWEEWRVAPIPNDMQNRTVEITGPVNSKMVINALNSGADCFMADFEDSHSPNWYNCIRGQDNLKKAVNRTLELKTTRKDYKLNETIAKLMVRPRGLHMVEKHMLVDGKPVSASIFDFGMFMFHNAKVLIDRGETPAFYLPKLEDSTEAKWWHNVINMTEAFLNVPHGSVRVTVLVETLPAAFRMDEILYELKEYAAGLNAGRWDYIFSAIKVLGTDPSCIFPNRSQVTMDTHMMSSYARLLVQTCHKRGAHAIGGMAAYIPRKDDFIENQKAQARVRIDKEREAYMGYDGTWVAHPGLIDIARWAFDKKRKDKRFQENNDDNVSREDLLQVPSGDFTYDELYNNIRVSLQYIHNWLCGSGCVAIDHLMEDLATVEISRTQVWQWRSHGVKLDDDDNVVDDALIDIIVDQIVINNPAYKESADIFSNLVKQEECENFSSEMMYDRIR